ncbi:UDP-2,4-diacetamido-2,4,6-trideoxy-beta-L-altropyranose hydrolase [Zobellella iuensis]|uniref:UDP-2,4-diacetamido-2,4, 6-trideoxy-beta-L-altropyranose hydrolase n=1 Tax=Zobellella iuensis TaxID=2803811 RepID=A0ABS1QU64_9GAMM|nr:UDP-2,4-diacetamido-2,4,6-trideoxy-beta-L-altropyranose hydrolase [Zobellella iuensis]MBL1378398.1 UDP-2,4-diacetamido-2,4,6-trideoxy-beta-L-altropyranose hydrolase [Zobellella iuensis]
MLGNIVFRTDASLEIGSGHVMRCLTLADALRERGADCRFICREHPGNLIEQVRNKGYIVHALPTMAPVEASSLAIPPPTAMPMAHSHWLGTTQEQDAEACVAILAELAPDWLIVDHYALDARWELALKPHYRKLMVIDDLADRTHQCDLLLDQTYGRNAADYQPWVPAGCSLLCGAQYALLRPEFAALRPYSLQRREDPRLQHLLITMGGVDKDNATGQVLQALKSTALPDGCRITVVMGSTAPWLDEVRQAAEDMPWPTTVRVGVSDMAQLMADSNLAIGAAGSTSWERCCLGLPTVMLVLADNQRQVAHGLELAGAVQVIREPQEVGEKLSGSLDAFTSSLQWLQEMSQAAANITDGCGVLNLIHQLEC